MVSIETVIGRRTPEIPPVTSAIVNLQTNVRGFIEGQTSPKDFSQLLYRQIDPFVRHMGPMEKAIFLLWTRLEAARIRLGVHPVEGNTISQNSQQSEKTHIRSEFKHYVKQYQAEGINPESLITARHLGIELVQKIANRYPSENLVTVLEEADRLKTPQHVSKKLGTFMQYVQFAVAFAGLGYSRDQIENLYNSLKPNRVTANLLRMFFVPVFTLPHVSEPKVALGSSANKR